MFFGTEDGHTASLFPGSPLLKGTRALAAAVMLDAKRHNRITVMLPVINDAKNVIFLVSGKNKAAIVKTVIEERDNLLPASLVMPRKGNLLFLLDAEAASQLSGKD
jgi:6-phosphogluconolactonase